VPGTIVVGVDGSPASITALQWAAEEAGLRGAQVVAIHAWSYVPLGAIGDPGMMPMPAGDIAGELEAERTAAKREFDNALAEAFPEGLPDGFDKRLVDGDAAEALASEAENADLIVVGSRGRGSFKAALLGSVSSHVVQHAGCPVVVVRAPT
jgi:nucleotide-binding universal stress UspA family protein